MCRIDKGLYKSNLTQTEISLSWMIRGQIKLGLMYQRRNKIVLKKRGALPLLARPVERGVKGNALLRQSAYFRALSHTDRVKNIDRNTETHVSFRVG